MTLLQGIQNTQLASTLYYAKSYIVKAVNIPVQEKNATCKMIASTESFLH